MNMLSFTRTHWEENLQHSLDRPQLLGTENGFKDGGTKRSRREGI